MKINILLLLVSALCVCYAQIQTINYNSFPDTSLFSLNGHAATLNPNSANVLRLCNNDPSCSASAFLSTAIPLEGPSGFKASFSTSFVFSISNPSGISDEDGPGADGLVFAINSVTANFGGAGGGIGYLGMSNSVGVEFDTYDNGFASGDPNGNHVNIDLGGVFASYTLAVEVAKRMNDGDRWYVWIDFNGDTTTMEVRLSLSSARPTAPLISENIDLVSQLGSPNVFVGFTSGTGGGQGIHDILSWTFTNQYAPLTTADPTTGTLNNPTTGTTANPTTGTTGTTGTTANPCVQSGGTYRTQSEGDWGDACNQGFETGCYRDSQFASCFGNALVVGCQCLVDRYGSQSGCGYSMTFTSSSAIQNYLPQLGAPSMLDMSYYNPSNPPPISTGSGNFGGQVTALALSLGFSACDPQFHTECASLGDLYICDDRCEACKRNSNQCNRNTQVHCQFVNDRYLDDEEYDLNSRNNKPNNQATGKPQYPNCEAFFGLQISQIFQAANDALGGCGSCKTKRENLMQDRNNQNENCVRNSGCRKKAGRNNASTTCSRNSSCKKNNDCCCCVDQSTDPLCDPIVLNACVALINQAFIFGKTLDDVASGTLFKEQQCSCNNGYQWAGTVNGQTISIVPFSVVTDMQDYYGYNTGNPSSADTPDGLEDSNSNNVLVEFVTDGFGFQNLLVIYDAPNSGSGGSAVSTISHNGDLAGASFIVEDDPGDSYTIQTNEFITDNNWNPCCTDGYVLGPIPNLACFTFTLGATTGITSLRLASNVAGGPTSLLIPKSDNETLVVNICNQCLVIEVVRDPSFECYGGDPTCVSPWVYYDQLYGPSPQCSQAVCAGPPPQNAYDGQYYEWCGGGVQDFCYAYQNVTIPKGQVTLSIWVIILPDLAETSTPIDRFFVTFDWDQDQSTIMNDQFFDQTLIHFTNLDSKNGTEYNQWTNVIVDIPPQYTNDQPHTLWIVSLVQGPDPEGFKWDDVEILVKT